MLPKHKSLPKMKRPPAPPSIPTRHRLIVADNSEKFGFGTGALRFPQEMVPENPGPAKYPQAPSKSLGPTATSHSPLSPQAFAAFGSTEGRFRGAHSYGPPVGVYDVQQVASRSRPVYRTPVVVHEHAKPQMPSPTRYDVPRRFGRDVKGGRAVFRSRVPRIPPTKVDGLFPWAYDVKDALLHPTAPRACSIRNTAPRMAQPPVRPSASAPFTPQPRPRSEGLRKPVPQARKGLTFTHRPRYVECMPPGARDQPGPGAYDVGKYGCIRSGAGPVAPRTLKNLQRAQEMLARYPNRTCPAGAPPATLYDVSRVMGSKSFHCNVADVWL